MSARALFAPERFERRLQIGLVAAFVALALTLVGLGLWLERPFRELTPSSHQVAAGETTTEVAQ